jgi:hypothetical protein
MELCEHCVITWYTMACVHIRDYEIDSPSCFGVVHTPGRIFCDMLIPQLIANDMNKQREHHHFLPPKII